MESFKGLSFSTFSSEVIGINEINKNLVATNYYFTVILMTSIILINNHNKQREMISNVYFL